MKLTHWRNEISNDRGEQVATAIDAVTARNIVIAFNGDAAKDDTIARLRELLEGTEHSLRYAGDLSHSQLVKIADDIRKELEQK
jgi:hypothetical protein